MATMDQRQKMLALLATIVGIIGIVVATENVVAGFLIVGFTVMAVVLAVSVNLRRELDIDIPDFRLPQDERRLPIVTGALLLLAFLPLLVPQVILVVAIATALVGLLRFWINWGSRGRITEEAATQLLLFLIAATLWLLVFQVPDILIVPITLHFAAFIFTLLPEKTRNKLVQELVNW